MSEDAARPQRNWEALGAGERPPREWIREQLWTPGIDPSSYTQPDGYRAAILEQYKTYVEMADRISARRGLANTFFITLNSAVFTLIGVFWKDRPPEPSLAALVILLAVALGQCAAWYSLVRSYRQLNAAKYDVVGLLEERLPASPYYAAEWAALKRGRDARVYWPLSHVEQWIPILFGLVYVAGAVLVATN